MDGRGIHVPQLSPVAPASRAASTRETFVVLKPLSDFNPAVFGPLVFRHVEYYQVRPVLDDDRWSSPCTPWPLPTTLLPYASELGSLEAHHLHAERERASTVAG